jgi:phospholipase C
MDGFDLNTIYYSTVPAGKIAYRYVRPSQIAPYWTLASQYVLADKFFATQASGSFTAHLDLIAGGTSVALHRRVINVPTHAPWGCDAPEGTATSLIDSDGRYHSRTGPFPCFTFPTLADLLDAKNVSWKYYAPPETHGDGGGLWNSFDAIDRVRHGPEWNGNVSMPPSNFFRDLRARKLAAVSWIVPLGSNSDHPGNAKDNGPSWVAQIVNAVGKSHYWKSTAIVVLWDDWGGFYDHVAPPQLTYDGLGFRVPCIFVSAYAKKGYVDHAQYEFGSVLKFIEDNWALGRLGTSDVRAASIVNPFDFSQPARKFVPVAAPTSQRYFERETTSGDPVDVE